MSLKFNPRKSVIGISIQNKKTNISKKNFGNLKKRGDLSIFTAHKKVKSGKEYGNTNTKESKRIGKLHEN
jgi:hypothetical protein